MDMSDQEIPMELKWGCHITFDPATEALQFETAWNENPTERHWRQITRFLRRNSRSVSDSFNLHLEDNSVGGDSILSNISTNSTEVLNEIVEDFLKYRQWLTHKGNIENPILNH